METRILAHGRISELELTTTGFSLGGTPFSIFLRTKRAIVTDTLVNCRCICDKDFADFPVVIGDWSPGLIVAIAPATIDPEQYDVYWGASEQPK